MMEKILDFDACKEALAKGEEELIPGEVVYAILDGENPIRVWREFRGLSQQDLAKKADITVHYLSQLEHGKRKGSIAVLSDIAKSLEVGIDELVRS